MGRDTKESVPKCLLLARGLCPLPALMREAPVRLRSLGLQVDHIGSGLSLGSHTRKGIISPFTESGTMGVKATTAWSCHATWINPNPTSTEDNLELLTPLAQPSGNAGMCHHALFCTVLGTECRAANSSLRQKLNFVCRLVFAPLSAT